MTIVDDLSTGRAENLEQAIERGAKLVVLDIRDAAELDGAFAAARPQVVFHLAAQIDVRKSVADPGWDAQINVGGTINVLRAALAHGVGRVVNSSTGGAIYGDARTIPSDRAHHARCRRPPTARASSPPRATSASSSACTRSTR